MKNHIKNLTVITVLIIGSTAFGSTKNIYKANNEILLHSLKSTNNFEPFVRLKEDKIYLTSLSLNKSPLMVEIYYESSETSYEYKIFSETIKDKINIQRIYQLDKTKKGIYKVVLITEGKSFIEYKTL